LITEKRRESFFLQVRDESPPLLEGRRKKEEGRRLFR